MASGGLLITNGRMEIGENTVIVILDGSNIHGKSGTDDFGIVLAKELKKRIQECWVQGYEHIIVYTVQSRALSRRNEDYLTMCFSEVRMEYTYKHISMNSNHEICRDFINYRCTRSSTKCRHSHNCVEHHIIRTMHTNMSQAKSKSEAEDTEDTTILKMMHEAVSKNVAKLILVTGDGNGSAMASFCSNHIGTEKCSGGCKNREKVLDESVYGRSFIDSLEKASTILGKGKVEVWGYDASMTRQHTSKEYTEVRLNARVDVCRDHITGKCTKSSKDCYHLHGDDAVAYMIKGCGSVDAWLVKHNYGAIGSSGEICQDFRRGRCTRGMWCMHRHEYEVCKNHLMGRCKRVHGVGDINASSGGGGAAATCTRLHGTSAHRVMELECGSVSAWLDKYKIRTFSCGGKGCKK